MSMMGFQLKDLARGLWNTITGNTQGGSTITMQLARNLFLSQEKTVSRKLSEIELAQKLEEKFSKNEILGSLSKHSLLWSWEIWNLGCFARIF